MISKTLIVNGMTKTLLVNPEDSLADVLRGQLLLTSVRSDAARVSAVPVM